MNKNSNSEMGEVGNWGKPNTKLWWNRKELVSEQEIDTVWNIVLLYYKIYLFTVFQTGPCIDYVVGK